jgi:hypothetical protein
VGDHVFLKVKEKKKFPEVGKLLKVGNSLLWVV